MNLIVHILVILFVIAEFCSQSLFPDNDGCSEPYDDISNLEKCTHTFYCLNSISRMDASRYSECQNVIYIRRTPHDLINVILKTTFYDQGEQKNIPQFHDFGDNELIYSLDLSNNDAMYVPTLEYMPNLAELKMTKCLLDTAKLSNKNELKALVDIDYSQNNIYSIEVVPGEPVFISLKKLNMSHNSLNNISEATFDLFPSIESLDLSDNFLDALDTILFGLKKLLHLNLARNRIANIDSSLLRLRHLVKLDLSHNSIQIVKASDLAKLANLQEIKLNSNGIHTIEKHAFENMASLTTVCLQDNGLDSLDQDLFINNAKLTNLYLSHNKIKTFPQHMLKGKIIHNFTIEDNQIEGPLERGTFEGMMKKLDLSGQYITSIENYAFAGLQKLETLLLNNNDVALLSNYSFKGLQNLGWLDLSYNKINKLDVVFEDLVNLQELSLNHNEIAHISSNNFISMGALQLLDLSQNNISYLGSNYFRSLKSLLNFKISENPLSGSIEEKVFDGLCSLPSLDISGTLITTLKNGSFMGMALLQELIFSHSNITELEYNSFSYASNIFSINLSYNQLQVFDVNTTDLKNLRYLLLSHNKLQVISEKTFDGLSVLNIIDLSHNDIRSIYQQTFYPLKDIFHLDLSYNPELKFDVSFVEKFNKLTILIISGTKTNATFKNTHDIPITVLVMGSSGIQNITRLSLGKLQSLERLELSNNAASKLQIGDLSNLTSLKQLDLSYNDIYYIQPGVFKDNTYLKLLNISHNKLLEISHGIFQGLLSVEIIDLSFNKINDLHRSRFYDVEHLKTLIADNNEIKFISEDEFLGTSLTELSIGNNPLPCKILYKLRKISFRISITAINSDKTKYNLKGVTCKKDDRSYDSKPNSEISESSLLLDMRNILYNVSKERFVIEPIAVQQNDFSSPEGVTKLEQKISQHSIEVINSIKNLSIISNQTLLINNNTNTLLGNILRVFKTKESSTLPTSKPIIVIKENGTSDGLISYINKIKQDLDESIAIEKQNVLELDDKIVKLKSKIDFSTKTPIHEKLLNSNEDRGTSSVFTEVCVGFILVILIAFILYKVYKSRFYIPSRRSRTSANSTRNIVESIENAQL